MSKDNKNNEFKKQDAKSFLEFMADNKKLVMPIILVIAVAITVVIALHANKKTAELVADTSSTSAESASGEYVVPEVDLELNAHEDVNALMNTYFTAYANGDMDTIKSIYVGLEESESLKLQGVSNYIDSFTTIDVYTKPGPIDGTYIAYVYTEVKFNDYENPVPGLQTMYVCTNEDGSLYINGDVVEDSVTKYISAISLQDDVVDLNNKVAAEYNDMIANDENLSAFLETLSGDIQVEVGEALAANEAGSDASTEGSSEATDASSESDSAAEGESTDAATEEASTETTTTYQIIRATDVINIRSSDSETADVIAKTEQGQEFTQLEALANGWSRIEYDGGEAYVKTEFFEVVGTTEEETEDATDESEETEETTEDTETEESEETTEDADTEETTDEDTEESDDTSSTTVDSNATGEMRVKETVRLRKSQSTDSENLTNIYAGDTVDVIEQYANGWAKVEYDGKTGYIMSEYLME